ncbi:alkaline phosphatase D family protein [Nocardia mexicana]|uniref:Phosphodiesterase/alkaline phosphatase D-like protein n=1 Tax=Nocardia mexicana TaxID=279262 RepID=A0A370HDF8_9NOCA|nr:alkaline phosphatase D family protein [Nocardia mexicana]RDI55274.1 phosphodiesterase/alkaline phosphatase D-like protein [Nocardia mexicana]
MSTRDRDRAALLGADRLHIFVPAIMSVGLLFWLASELRELVRSSGDAARAKRSAIDGHAVARFTTATHDPDSPARRGLRPRPVYLLIALTLWGGAVYVTIGSVANYFQQPGWVADIAWLLCLSLGVVAIAGYYGTVAAIVFARYPAPPPTVSRTLTNTPLTTRPVEGEQWLAQPPWQLGAGFLAALAASSLLSLVVAASPYVVAGFDRSVADWFRGLSAVPWSRFTTFAFDTRTVVALVVLVGLATLRCRALAVAYATATGFGLLASAGLRTLIERGRPPGGPMAGAVDSYPSGHIIQAVVIAGLVPLALATLTHRRRLVAPLTIVLGAAAVAAAADRVAEGLHWPTDVLGGAGIGLALVLGARWVVERPRAHVACRGCLWSPHSHLRSPAPRGAIPLSVSGAQIVRLFAHLSAGAVAVTLAVLTVTVGVPSSGEGFVFGSAVETPVQLALAGVVSIGALLSWRWEALGAVLIALAATMLGIFAAVEYQPIYAMALAGGAMVPSVLLWLSWQHRRTALELLVLAIVTLLLLGATWVGASRVYAIYFGPTHPESTAPALAVDRVDWVWSGELRPDGLTVTARLAAGHRDAALRIVADDGTAVDTAPVAAGEHRIARMRAEGLRPGTRYAYTVVVDGTPDSTRGIGRFTTPVDGPMSFRVTVGACARVGSNGAVFDALAAEQALFYLALGDLHYANIESTTPAPFFAAYDRLLTRPGQAALYRSNPIAYVWDDHDYGPNDAGAAAPGREASRTAFGTTVPHYPFTSASGTVNQAFTIGRVRFVLTDDRSAETETSMLGTEQLRWLTDELVQSSRTHALVVWGNSVPWIGAARPGADGWAGHADERQRIADALAAANVRNLVSVGGDAHMVAIDDGTNSDYSSQGGAGFPILQAASLDRPGSVKGGPYSEGTFPGGGRYGVLDVTDNGATVTVTLTGKRWDGTVLTRYEYSVPRVQGGP